MPKVSQEHLERRREQILAGARRAFARHGFEGATVNRLEEETGLSRGAIFHYFPSKADVFLALAERDDEHLAGLLLEHGIAGVIRALPLEDPDWLRTRLETVSRLHTDPDFRVRWEKRNHLDRAITRLVERERRHGNLRTDVPKGALARFLGVVLDGVFMQVPTIGLPRDVGPLLRVIEDAVRPR